MDAMKLTNYLRAGFPAFWLKTTEPDRVKKSVYKSLQDFRRKDGSQYKVLEWNCAQEPDPMSVFTTLDSSDELAVMFLYNYHWFIDKPMIIQNIQDRLPVWSNTLKAIVVVSPKNGIPAELEKDFVVLDLSLPKENEIIEAIEHVAPKPEHVPKGKELQQIVNAAKGFTRAGLENTLALSLVENQRFDVTTLNEHRAMEIRKSGFLEIVKPTTTFEDVVGYDELKSHVLDTVHEPKAKGIICIGPPGCGKTTLMKAVVTESKKIGVSVNMGKLQSKWRGETDQNINATIDLITTLGDCFVLIDEFEKQFAGAGGSGASDDGATKRSSGRWLEFLQDRPEGIYVCATANSFEGIPGEYLRAGRWDSSPFFIDLPSKKVRMKILEHYLDKAGLKKPKVVPEMKDYSGAEIEALVHIATMRKISLQQASESIIPQAITMKDRVDALRVWAKSACAQAEKIPGVKVVKTAGKRKIDA